MLRTLRFNWKPVNRRQGTKTDNSVWLTILTININCPVELTGAQSSSDVTEPCNSAGDRVFWRIAWRGQCGARIDLEALRRTARTRSFFTGDQYVSMSCLISVYVSFLTWDLFSVSAVIFQFFSVCLLSHFSSFLYVSCLVSVLLFVSSVLFLFFSLCLLSYFSYFLYISCLISVLFYMSPVLF